MKHFKVDEQRTNISGKFIIQTKSIKPQAFKNKIIIKNLIFCFVLKIKENKKDTMFAMQ